MEGAVTLQVGVKVLLRNKNGIYLLVHRSSAKYPNVDGRWDIVGGRIHAGTPLVDNLKREVAEETGLTLVGEPRLVAAQDILRDPSRHVVRLTYLGEAEGAVRLDAGENDEYAWHNKEALLALADIDRYFKELMNTSPEWLV